MNFGEVFGKLEYFFYLNYVDLESIWSLFDMVVFKGDIEVVLKFLKVGVLVLLKKKYGMLFLF